MGWLEMWQFGYMATVIGLLFATFSHWAYDDPFITYRYAVNLRQGLGFVYNPGERVLSTTTPLFSILLAVLGILWSDLPRLAILLGALSLALGGLALWSLASARAMPWTGWAALLLYPTFPLLVGTLGSEMPLYLAFCLGAFACYARHRLGLTAILAALAVLTRPDGLLVVVLLAGHYLLRSSRSVPWPAIGLFLGLIIPWLAFAWAYFGSPVPATLAAKQHQGSMPISQLFAPGLWTIVKGYAARWPYWLEALLALVGLLFALRQARPFVLLFVWTALYFLSYSLLGVTRYFWYYAPLVPSLAMAVGLGVMALGGQGLRIANGAAGQSDIKIVASSVRSLAGVVVPGLRSMRSVLAAGLVFLLTLTQMGDLWVLRQSPDKRLALYQAIGKWLEANTPAGSSVGVLEVGIIGYYAQRRMVDFAGLIQPDVAAQLTPHTTYEDAALWAVAHYRPDYLVLQDGAFPLLEEVVTIQHCRPMQHFPGETYGAEGNWTVYACGR